MLYRILSACAVLLFLAGCAAPPASPVPAAASATMPIKCGKLDDVLHDLQKNARYAYTADAIDSHGRVYEWYVNPKTRHWVQIHVYSNLRACIEMKGSYWHWALDH